MIVSDNAKYFLALRDVPRYPGISKAFAVSPEEAQGRVPVVIKAKDVNVLDYDVDVPQRGKSSSTSSQLWRAKWLVPYNI